VNLFVKVHLDSDLGEIRQIFREFERSNSSIGKHRENLIANSGGKHRFSLNVRDSEKNQDWLAERVGFEPTAPFHHKNRRFLGGNSLLVSKSLIGEKVNCNWEEYPRFKIAQQIIGDFSGHMLRQDAMGSASANPQRVKAERA
jgi:hypothetical protein